jgi:hypothetical protein
MEQKTSLSGRVAARIASRAPALGMQEHRTPPLRDQSTEGRRLRRDRQDQRPAHGPNRDALTSCDRRLLAPSELPVRLKSARWREIRVHDNEHAFWIDGKLKVLMQAPECGWTNTIDLVRPAGVVPGVHLRVEDLEKIHPLLSSCDAWAKVICIRHCQRHAAGVAQQLLQDCQP